MKFRREAGENLDIEATAVLAEKDEAAGVAGECPGGEKVFEAATGADGLGEPEKGRWTVGGGAGGREWLQGKRIGDDGGAPAAVAGVEGGGEGVGRGKFQTSAF